MDVTDRYKVRTPCPSQGWRGRRGGVKGEGERGVNGGKGREERGDKGEGIMEDRRGEEKRAKNPISPRLA